MTKQIDEFFNLPDLEDDNKPSKEVATANASTEVGTLGIREEEHDAEMNNVHSRAIDLHDEIAEVARNVEPGRSARMFEVSGQFLKTAMDASNSKIKRQMDAAKLKLDAARLKVDDDSIAALDSGREIVADRNEMIRMLLNKNDRDEIVDVEPEENDKK